MNDKLFIIGNGKSFDTNKLYILQKHKTFGLNLGYKGFTQYNFTPTYYGFFQFERERYRIAADDDIKNYVLNSNIREVFTLPQDSHVFSGLCTDDRPNPFASTIYTTDQVDACGVYGNNLPWHIHVDCVCSTLSDVAPEQYNRIQELLGVNQVEYSAFNSSGIRKYIDGIPLTRSDYITKPRIGLSYILPVSFTSFYWNTIYNSAIMAVLIGMLCGYKTFILTGVDSDYKFTGNVLESKKNYWFDSEDIVLPDDIVKTNYTNRFLDAWFNLKISLAVNNKNIKIINTSIGSPLSNIFETKELSSIV